ncbi:hypothetical protein [Sinomonas sp. P47F7]
MSSATIEANWSSEREPTRIEVSGASRRHAKRPASTMGRRMPIAMK